MMVKLDNWRSSVPKLFGPGAVTGTNVHTGCNGKCRGTKIEIKTSLQADKALCIPNGSYSPYWNGECELHS